jgi:CRP-like cAMP-binding protein
MTGETPGMPATVEAAMTASGDETGEVMRLAAGETLFREGDPADFLCRVVAGELDIWKEPAGGESYRMATLVAGAVIGECGVLAGQPRNATVVARTDATVWAVSRESFLTAAELGHPWAVRLLLAAAGELAERLRRVAVDLVEATSSEAQGQRESAAPPAGRRTAELQQLRDRLVEWSF